MTWSLEFAGDDDQDRSDFVEKRVERKALLPVKPIHGHIRERFMSPKAVEAEFGRVWPLQVSYFLYFNLYNIS